MSSSNIGSTSRSTYDSAMSGLGKIGSSIYHAPGELSKLLFGVTVKPVTGIRNLMGKMGEMFFSYKEKQADIPLDTTFSSPSLVSSIPTQEEITAAKESLSKEGISSPSNQEIYKKIIEQRVNTLTDYQKLLRETDKSLDLENQTTLDNLELILKSLQNNSSRKPENVTNAPSTSEQPVNQNNDTQEITADIKDQTSQDNTQINDLLTLLTKSKNEYSLKIFEEAVKKNLEEADAHEGEKAGKNLLYEEALKDAELLAKQAIEEKALREAEAEKAQARIAAKVKLTSEIEAANTKVKETHGALNDLYYSIAGKTGAWNAELKNTLQPLKEKIVNKELTVNILEPQTPDDLKKTKESLQILLGKMKELKPQENFEDLTKLLNAISNIKTPKA